MYYGIDIASSGVLTSLARLDAMANNLANIDTVGYKPVEAATMQRDHARREDGLHFLPSNALLERLGGGLLLAPSRVSFRQGTIDTTGNELDLAIEGEGFLVARTSSDANADSIALTRDGRMTLDDRGRLVLASSGNPIIDTAGRPIRLIENTPVEIDNRGFIRQDGNIVAQLRFVDLPDRRALRPIGDTLFALDAAAAGNLRPATGRITQRAVEGSAVDQVRALLAVQSASSAVGANIGTISYQDRMVERAINTFARMG
ncbi:MAG: flagellar hook-basal body complex protein [Phycisphaeraceae bacterium]|nr:flagellar hook-basal body complex protein [Phycisphaeraceae bacterium]MCW5762494.1 flagellar hook-basal body complex protein [Phycisphaeraceae bacterium]